MITRSYNTLQLPYFLKQCKEIYQRSDKNETILTSDKAAQKAHEIYKAARDKDLNFIQLSSDRFELNPNKLQPKQTEDSFWKDIFYSSALLGAVQSGKKVHILFENEKKLSDCLKQKDSNISTALAMMKVAGYEFLEKTLTEYIFQVSPQNPCPPIEDLYAKSDHITEKELHEFVKKGELSSSPSKPPRPARPPTQSKPSEKSNIKQPLSRKPTLEYTFKEEKKEDFQPLTKNALEKEIGQNWVDWRKEGILDLGETFGEVTNILHSIYEKAKITPDKYIVLNITNIKKIDHTNHFFKILIYILGALHQKKQIQVLFDGDKNSLLKRKGSFVKRNGSNLVQRQKEPSEIALSCLSACEYTLIDTSDTPNQKEKIFVFDPPKDIDIANLSDLKKMLSGIQLAQLKSLLTLDQKNAST